MFESTWRTGLFGQQTDSPKQNVMAMGQSHRRWGCLTVLFRYALPQIQGSPHGSHPSPVPGPSLSQEALPSVTTDECH